ncbi:hypothetical protein Agub_g2308 [Astrephomene gubernaculifera]|uniref:Uncharacterized protein n=1 Tax=Astrephomene gubernaculifera TaxID=47775 RepID=A0AAD3HI03_9CHLO|nr:hypothetical protein Agub_g2308 [Astrephomene gubernaculifera]
MTAGILLCMLRICVWSAEQWITGHEWRCHDGEGRKRRPGAARRHMSVHSRCAALAGVLLVEPEQLLPLVNGSLRLDHREAIKYVRLRQDFNTARVQGRSLQQVFGGGDAVPGGQQAGDGGGGEKILD